MKYRLKYAKLGAVKFIGHLDLIHVFQRAINRANLPVAYSKGFNPHQLMSFAFPLSVGYESIGEYVDIELYKEIGADDFISSMNNQLPDGIKIADCVLLNSDDKNAMSQLRAASYEAVLNVNLDIKELNKSLYNYLSQSEILINKKGKKGIKEIDIRKDIKELSLFTNNDNLIVIEMFLSAGSIRNLKPELVIQSFYSFINQPYDINKINFMRTELFRKLDNEYIAMI